MNKRSSVNHLGSLYNSTENFTGRGRGRGRRRGRGRGQGPSMVTERRTIHKSI